MACAVLALCGKSLYILQVSLYCKSLYSKSAQTPLLVVILSGISVRTLCLTAHGIVFAGSFFYYIFFSGPACPCLFLWNLSRYSLWRPIPNEPPSALFFACFKYRGRKGSHSIAMEQTFLHFILNYRQFTFL